MAAVVLLLTVAAVVAIAAVAVTAAAAVVTVEMEALEMAQEIPCWACRATNQWANL
jgi:hypothetical protein